MDFADFDPTLLLAPFMLCVLVMSVIAWLAMLGGSLKFSLWLLLDDPPGYPVCLAMAVLILAINASVGVGMHLLFEPQPWYVVISYQAMLQVFLVMALARCNPVSAFFAAFAHSFFSLIGTVAVIVTLFVAGGSAIVGAQEQRERNEQIAQPRIPTAVANPYMQD